jgi:transcriptional regulator with XRE-family HTH domain
MRKLGAMLRDGRRRTHRTQAEAAFRAGISRSEWSGLELGRKSATMATLNRAAHAVGGSLEACIRETSAADRPRDAVHLKAQNLIIATSAGGAWKPLPEVLIDREARTSSAADVLLERLSRAEGVREYALWDIREWIDDVGGAVRDFTRRVAGLERFAISRMAGDEPLPRTGGVFVLRATSRNRELVHENRPFFAARFPSSALGWLRTLEDPEAPIPSEAALVWVNVEGDRLYASRLG